MLPQVPPPCRHPSKAAALLRRMFHVKRIVGIAQSAGRRSSGHGTPVQGAGWHVGFLARRNRVCDACAARYLTADRELHQNRASELARSPEVGRFGGNRSCGMEPSSTPPGVARVECKEALGPRRRRLSPRSSTGFAGGTAPRSAAERQGGAPLRDRCGGPPSGRAWWRAD